MKKFLGGLCFVCIVIVVSCTPAPEKAHSPQSASTQSTDSIASAPIAPGRGHAIRREASILWNSSRPDEARQLLRDAIKSPENKDELVSTLRQCGSYAFDMDDRIEARECFIALHRMVKADTALLTRHAGDYREAIFYLSLLSNMERQPELAALYTAEYLSHPPSLEGEDNHLAMTKTHATTLAKQSKTDEAAAALRSARDQCPTAWRARYFENELLLLRYTDPTFTSESSSCRLVELWQMPEAITNPAARSVGITLMQSYFKRSMRGEGMDTAYEISARIPEWKRICADMESRSEISPASQRDLDETLVSVLSNLQGAASHGRPQYVEYAETAMARIEPPNKGKVQRVR